MKKKKKKFIPNTFIVLHVTLYFAVPLIMILLNIMQTPPLVPGPIYNIAPY